MWDTWWTNCGELGMIELETRIELPDKDVTHPIII